MTKVPSQVDMAENAKEVSSVIRRVFVEEMEKLGNRTHDFYINDPQVLQACIESRRKTPVTWFLDQTSMATASSMSHCALVWIDVIQPTIKAAAQAAGKSDEEYQAMLLHCQLRLITDLMTLMKFGLKIQDEVRGKMQADDELAKIVRESMRRSKPGS